MKLGYARVSTEDQRLDLQRARLIEAGCGKLFEEKVSGAARQRPALEQLLRELRADDILVVTRLDRLARSTAELLRIAEVISEKNAGLPSLGEPWADTTTPAGRMVLTMFAGVAEFERSLIKHRTDEGRQAAKRRGVWTAAEATARSEDPCPLPGPPWSRKAGPSAKSPGPSTSTPPPSTAASTRPKPPIRPYDSTPYRSDARASHRGADEDAVLGMRLGSRDGATRAHRPGLSPVPLSRVRQAVQRAQRRCATLLHGSPGWTASGRLVGGEPPIVEGACMPFKA